MKIKLHNEKEFSNKEMRNVFEGISELHKFYKRKIGENKVSDIISNNTYEYKILDEEYVMIREGDIEIWGKIEQQNSRPSVSILVEGEEDRIHVELTISENGEIEVSVER